MKSGSEKNKTILFDNKEDETITINNKEGKTITSNKESEILSPISKEEEKDEHSSPINDQSNPEDNSSSHMEDDDSSSLNNNQSSLIEDDDSSSLSEEVSEEDCDYFGDDKCFLSSSSEEEAWADSESDEEVLREKYKNEPDWLNNKKFKKSQIKKSSRFSISFTPGLFKTNYSIKIIKHYSSNIFLVDTMNIIYILKDYKLVHCLRLDKWGVSDVTLFNNKLLICNNKLNKIKQVIDGDIKDINKIYTRNINRLVVINTNLYLLGDTVQLLNEDLEVVEESYNNLINLVQYKDDLLGLSSNGDILQFTEDLVLINKIIYTDKFSFRDIRVLGNLISIMTYDTIIFINEDFKYKKEIKGDTSEITVYKDLYLYFTEAGMKIYNKEFVIINTKIKKCRTFVNTGDSIIMCQNREIHKLTINHK
ncbi:WD40 repeat domain-containing protein [Vairimorpha necatrix]|uniref:WD40 repeat domain-containing protein n=1 Tax=Vairimorpha necatrix TaxID=6039 RepID=A0AAX4J956_9MICR